MTAGAPAPGQPVILSWYGCDLRTGQIIEDLPSLKPTQPLSRRLGASTSATFELALGGAPLGWEAATDQGRTLLVGVDQLTDLPVWAGIVLTRDGGSGPSVTLGTATAEAYLDRRFTGSVTLFQQDQGAIVAALLTAPMSQGPPFVLDDPGTGRLADYTVLDSDDKTVLSALQELMGMEKGPEWTVDVAWADETHSGFVLPIRVRSSVGTQASRPEAVFDFPGCVSSYVLTESYEQGKGATVVQARGEGEGEARLSSAAQVSPLEDAGWPRYVHRYTPASGLTDPDKLTAHAVKSLRAMETGGQAWQIDAVASQAPRLGRDWGLGDAVLLAVDSSPRHPAGAEVIARAWSWELDPAADRIRPILIEEN
ncbi:hypothetical protein AB0M23_28340 [Streptomyces sp. NPDC052077]|uniref:hypothetical protein n=1 Tax=Streptomyces sp. NPDC052077 TaxID=3154757 RepID=UPI003439F6C6